MNVLIVSKYQFGYLTDFYYFAKYLKKGNKVIFFCRDEGKEKVAMEGVEVAYYKAFSRYHYIDVITFCWWIFIKSFRHKTNVIFINHFSLCSLVRLFFPFKRIVLDIRTGNITQNEKTLKRRNRLLKLETCLFNDVTIVSDSLAERLKIKNYQLLPLGAEVRLAPKQPSQTFNLLYIGVLDNRKIEDTIIGLKLFIEKNRPETLIRYELIGYGQPEQEKKIRHLIGNLDLEETVIFHGRKSLLELIPFFERASVGVSYLPKLSCYECQPLTKTYEYLFWGLPVIATNTYENQKIINGRNGVLVNDNPQSFSEGLKTVFDRIDSYEPEDIKRSVADYSWEKIVENQLNPFLHNV